MNDEWVNQKSSDHKTSYICAATYEYRIISAITATLLQVINELTNTSYYFLTKKNFILYHHLKCNS
jgi:hypothetical protein